MTTALQFDQEEPGCTQAARAATTRRRSGRAYGSVVPFSQARRGLERFSLDNVSRVGRSAQHEAIAVVHEEFLQAGLPATLHVNARKERD